jgi:hypothetical protein
MSETWTHFHFNLLEVDIQTVYDIQWELLQDYGVSFDTGTNIRPEGPREWHTDWSLDGPWSVEDIAKFLDGRGVSYTLVKVPKIAEE